MTNGRPKYIKPKPKPSTKPKLYSGYGGYNAYGGYGSYAGYNGGLGSYRSRIPRGKRICFYFGRFYPRGSIIGRTTCSVILCTNRGRIKTGNNRRCG